MKGITAKEVIELDMKYEGNKKEGEIIKKELTALINNVVEEEEIDILMEYYS